METQIDNVAQMLLEVTRSLVDRPEDLTVTTVHEGDVSTVRISAHPVDTGRLIGVGGRTARALRVLAHASSMKLKHPLIVDICSQEEAELHRAAPGTE
jgi:hypothetical protein